MGKTEKCFRMRIGEDYPKDRELADSLAGEIPLLGTLEYKRKIRSTGEDEDKEARTVSVRNEFKRIRTEEELRRFFFQNKEAFGMHHNTAYRKFMKILEYLKKLNMMLRQCRMAGMNLHCPFQSRCEYCWELYRK